MTDFATQLPPPPQSDHRDEITVGKTLALTASGQEVRVFTMTLGGETIELLPLRNWSQLDVYKWRARGKLPGTPAGLEITFDHVKVSGGTVSLSEPEGTAKLQKLLNEWLALETGAFKSAQQKAHAKPASVEQETRAPPENLIPHFQVEVDKEGHVHIYCRQGKETLATIGLNLPGFTSLFNEGLMHKPHALKVGALHDWVEIDGEFFSFEKGNNDAAKLETALNERYLFTTARGQGKDVVVFTNAASSTGFDIQFAAKVGGVTERRRRPLNEEALELLQSPDKCGLLPKDVVIKLSRPHLIFKHKTPDGGERYLDEGPDSIVTVVGDEGETTIVDLSQPVNYLRLSAVVLTAVFNHPAINQHSRLAPQPTSPSDPPKPAQVPKPQPAATPPRAQLDGPIGVRPSSGAAGQEQGCFGPQSGAVEQARPAAPEDGRTPLQPRGSVVLSSCAVPSPEPTQPLIPKLGVATPIAPPATVIRPLPNLWLQAILERPAARHDWFACLVYTRMAEHFGNSLEGYFGPFPCWACSLGDVEEISDPAFRGVFLTQKGGLGYLNHGHVARFRNEVAFIGTLESAIEVIGVDLLAVGADAQQRVVFIVTEGYRAKFGLPEQTVAEELARLRNYGALVLSTTEVLQSPDPIEVVWTVPAQQEKPDDPQAVENLRPVSTAANSVPAKDQD